MSLQSTPQSNRLHIALFGKRNSGKSALMNALTHQSVSLVSEVAGTTTDPVIKAMEIAGLGAVLFIDTAGFDDQGTLGKERVKKSMEVATKTDVALVLCNNSDVEQEQQWIRFLQSKDIPVVVVVNKADLHSDALKLSSEIEQAIGIKPVVVSAVTGFGVTNLVEALKNLLPQLLQSPSIVGHLVAPSDVVLLVMPQDAQAPKGRLILPQVQTIRDLLDNHCIVVSCTIEQFPQTLQALKEPPHLIITDSQAFSKVYELKPDSSALTSFSVLFAQYKGDVKTFIKGAAVIDTLKENNAVLIAEACTHVPLQEDIGREKIPAMLRKRIGDSLRVDIVSGSDFPTDLSQYALIIHCGACMFNRKLVLQRMAQADAQHIPITNYGIAIAHLTGILDKVVY